MLTENELTRNREQMVMEHLAGHGIRNSRVLNAMRKVPRHAFIPVSQHEYAYENRPLPIGHGQTISQPYVVALMTEILRLSGVERILEVGTGCGYQTALLCELCSYVYTLERHPLLADRAATTLEELGYSNVDIHIGDGSQGLPDMHPFDAILVTAAAPLIPGPLVSQLNVDNGRLLVPVGGRKNQHLMLVMRLGNQCKIKKGTAVRFVPLLGRYGFKPDGKDADHSAEV